MAPLTREEGVRRFFGDHVWRSHSLRGLQGRGAAKPQPRLGMPPRCLHGPSHVAWRACEPVSVAIALTSTRCCSNVYTTMHDDNVELNKHRSIKSNRTGQPMRHPISQ